MTDIIKELAQREAAKANEARADYWSLVEALAADTEGMDASDTGPILERAGKTVAELEADLVLARRERELASQVADLGEAQAQLRAAREEGQAMRARHEEERRRMKAEEDDLKVRDFALTTHVQDLRESARELEELRMRIEHARAGAVSKPAPVERKRPTAHQLRPATPKRADGWSPPSPFDYDTVEGSHEGRRVFFYRHRSTGAVMYPPSHPRYAG